MNIKGILRNLITDKKIQNSYQREDALEKNIIKK